MSYLHSGISLVSTEIPYISPRCTEAFPWAMAGDGTVVNSYNVGKTMPWIVTTHDWNGIPIPPIMVITGGW